MSRNQLSEKLTVPKKKIETPLQSKEQKFVAYLRSIGGMDVHQFDDANEATEYGQTLRKTIDGFSLIDVEITYRTVRVRLKE